MRVLIDARSLAERNTSNRTYWSELVTALGQRGGVELILASNVELSMEDVPPGAEVVVHPSGGRLFSILKLPKIAQQRKADVVHVQYTASALFRTPVVTTIHDVSFFIEPSWFGLKDRLLLQRSVPAACRRAACVLAPSATCREEILAHIDVPPEKVRVTLEGTPSRLLGLEGGDEETKGLVGGRPFVLLVGGASPRKNLAGAVEATREARKVLPDLRLLVTGRIEGKPLEPWIVAPGPLPERVLASAYRQAHALVHPSLHEGFGLTILEAMALGCPVVASDRGSIPEIAGDGALLFDPFDFRGMADGLVRLVNPAFRADIVERGRKRSEGYSWLETATRTIEAYGVAAQARPLR